jgi:hypothetical protein
MKFDTEHFRHLKNSYREVGCKINDRDDFTLTELESSISLFHQQSPLESITRPIDVDVFAVLAGISFEKTFLSLIDTIYTKLLEIIRDNRFYLVEPKNLGVEYAVLKWPEDKYDPEIIKQALNVLDDFNGDAFYLKVFGIQLHTDGCIILKCVDENQSIFKLRKTLVSRVENIPKKQSNWVHIPLGRILSPIGRAGMVDLKAVIAEIDNELDYDIFVESIHVVHEKTWYMKNKSYLATKELRNVNGL